MFGGGGGQMGGQVGANVVLTADNSGYNSAMQQSAGYTSQLGQAYDSLHQKIDNGFKHLAHASFGVAAADTASVVAATAAAARYESQMRSLNAQAMVLDRTYGSGTQRMNDYGRAVDNVRSKFGEATSAASQLVQTISGFQSGGSTQGLSKLASDFEHMSMTTGENSAALAQSVLSLGQAMGTSLGQVKGYNDQLTTMAALSNTNATQLANFTASIAPLGRQLNMTQSQLTGFAAAFSKAGQDGYRATNVFSQMTSDIAQSLQSNNPRLQQYANLLGVTTQALKSMQGAQIAGGLFDAIGRQGPNALQTLNTLGYDGVNVVRTVSAVTQQAGPFGGPNGILARSQNAYGNGASTLGKETVGEEFGKARQNIEQAGESLGEAFLPALKEVMTFVDKLTQSVSDFMDGPGGDLVKVMAALVAPAAALAGALVSMHSAFLPLMALLAVKRSSVGTGFMDAMMNRQSATGAAVAAGNAPSRYIAGGYKLGAGVGGIFAPSGTSRMDYILRGRQGGKYSMFGTPAAEAAAEVGAAETGAAMGLFGRARQGVGRGAAFLERNLWATQFYGAAEKDPVARFNRFGAVAPFGGLFSKKGSMADEAEARASQSAAAADSRLAAAADAVTGAFKNALGAISAWGAAVGDSADVTVASTAATGKKAAAENVDTVANGRLAESAAVASGGLLAVAKSAAASAAMGAAGGARALGGGAMAVGGMGLRAGASLAGGAMDLLGGPVGVGILALSMAPMIKSMFSHQTEAAPPDPISGTGLPFTVSGVQGAMPRSGVSFNPNHPSAAALYQAQQGDYQTDFFSHDAKPTPEQVAAMYGPMWGQMTTQQRQMIIGDAAKAYNGNVGPLLQMLNSGQYSSYSASSAQTVSGLQGGLSALYQNQANRNFSTLRSPAGANLQSVATDFLSTQAHLQAMATLNGMSVNDLQSRRYSNAQMGDNAITIKGGSVKYFGQDTTTGSDLVTQRQAGGLFGINTHRVSALTDTGQALGKALGQDTSENSAFASLLASMPSNLGGGQAQMRWLLQHMSGDQLTSALSAAGEQNITGDQATNLALALKDFNAHSSKELASAFRGMHLTRQQQTDIANEDQTNPAYGAQMLFSKGVTPMQMLRMMNSGLNPQTMQAYLAYGSQQYGAASAFMTPAQQLLGSTSGIPGQSGLNAGMLQTPFGSMSGQFSLLGSAQLQLKNVQHLANTGQLTGADLTGMNTAVANLEQGYIQQLATMKQYSMQLQQMAFSEQQFRQSMHWQAEQEHLTVARERADEARNVSREEYNYHLQRKRGEDDFNRQRRYNERDFHLQRTRAEADFAHQTGLMIKQAAMSMHDIYKQDQAQGFTSAEFLLSNNTQQTQAMLNQERQLDQLRNMGLSTNAIQQLGLTNASSAQELNGLFSQIQQNPSLIDQLNQAVQQRLSAAGALATDESSMTWQEQEHQFKISLDRGQRDFNTSMKRSKDAFDLQMSRSAHDFTRQMSQQNQDFELSLTRQAHDFNVSMAHSWTSFHQQVANSMTQLNESVQPLSADTKDLYALAKKLKGTAMGDEALALAKSTPKILKVIQAITDLAHLKVQTVPNSTIYGAPNAVTNSGGTGRGGVGAGLPAPIQQRMAADSPTAGMCLHDVADVLGTPHGEPDPVHQWADAAGNRGHMNTAPIGAPIFFPGSYGGGNGHIAINAGGGMMWSQDSGAWVKKAIWSGVQGWSSVLEGVRLYPKPRDSFAQGAWDLPSDRMAHIHKGEMILPAKVAEIVRSVVTKGQAANMSTRSHPAVAYVDARTYSTSQDTTFTGDICVKAENPMQFMQQMQAQARLKAMTRR